MWLAVCNNNKNFKKKIVEYFSDQQKNTKFTAIEVKRNMIQDFVSRLADFIKKKLPTNKVNEDVLRLPALHFSLHTFFLVKRGIQFILSEDLENSSQLPMNNLELQNIKMQPQ